MVFEAVTNQASFWKRLIDSMKELVTESNFHCNADGMCVQAMDSAHVALVHLALHAEGFQHYNCERSNVMGVNLANMSKVLKAIEGGDKLTLRAEEDADILSIAAENEKNTKMSEFALKLMEIDGDQMSLPPAEYCCVITLASSDFAKVCRDMKIFGDTINVAVERNGVRFSANGDVGEAAMFFKASDSYSDQIKSESSQMIKSEPAHESPAADTVKGEPVEDDQGADADDAPIAAQPPKKKIKKEGGATTAASEDLVAVEHLEEPIALAFALRYFDIFSKACGLSNRVRLSLAHDCPCLIEFQLENSGSLKYYLAPKVDTQE